jgi:hypothetical protein
LWFGSDRGTADLLRLGTRHYWCTGDIEVG